MDRLVGGGRPVVEFLISAWFRGARFFQKLLNFHAEQFWQVHLRAVTAVPDHFQLAARNELVHEFLLFERNHVVLLTRDDQGGGANGVKPGSGVELLIVADELQKNIRAHFSHLFDIYFDVFFWCQVWIESAQGDQSARKRVGVLELPNCIDDGRREIMRKFESFECLIQDVGMKRGLKRSLGGTVGKHHARHAGGILPVEIEYDVDPHAMPQEDGILNAEFVHQDLYIMGHVFNRDRAQVRRGIGVLVPPII